MNRKICDAEIQSRNGNWIGCKRRPKWTIQASSGSYLEYCNRHKKHAFDKRCMTPAPFAKLVPLVATESKETELVA